MDTPGDPIERKIRCEMLQRAVALGDELIRMSDELDLPIAGLHICQGVELLREDVERLSE